ncbi:MAG: hypothetical protein GQ525_15090 [Draconibacterium sp.]|nr:hypothetical protein [Draconibacterium sp.]
MKKFLSLLLILFFPIFLIAQISNEIATDTINRTSHFSAISDTIHNYNVFANDIPLDITLRYDITSFIRNKNKGEYIDAVMEIHYGNNQVQTKNIRLKARGNFRRGHCMFPPIRLNFKTDPIENKVLKGANKIKLVTHCSTTKEYEKYILKEYLAYKLYNVLTDKSFKVKLLNITYIDTGKKKKNYQQYGFLIEPVELLATRNTSIEVEPTIIRKENVLEVDADRVALFQYMIANTDWRIKAGHNTKFLKSLTEVTNQVVSVPYDFDFSGFVETRYSYPQSWTSIKEITDREYLGYCRDNDQAYLDNIKRFEEKKDEILKTIEEFSYLDERERKYLKNYIGRFFTEIKRPENFLVTLKSECRSRVDF